VASLYFGNNLVARNIDRRHISDMRLTVELHKDSNNISKQEQRRLVARMAVDNIAVAVAVYKELADIAVYLTEPDNKRLLDHLGYRLFSTQIFLANMDL